MTTETRQIKSKSNHSSNANAIAGIIFIMNRDQTQWSDYQDQNSKTKNDMASQVVINIVSNIVGDRIDILPTSVMSVRPTSYYIDRLETIVYSRVETLNFQLETWKQFESWSESDWWINQ